MKTKQEILDKIKALVGEENTSDETLSLIEDVSDAWDEFDMKPDEDWKTKYEENDKMWRQKYRDRFYNIVDEGEERVGEPPVSEPETQEEETVIENFEDLFSEVK